MVLGGVRIDCVGGVWGGGVVCAFTVQISVKYLRVGPTIVSCVV